MRAGQAAFEMRDEGRQIAAYPQIIRHLSLPPPAVLGEGYRRTPVVSKPSTRRWTGGSSSGIAVPKSICLGGNDEGYGGGGGTAGVCQELHRLSVAGILRRLGRLVARCHRFRSVLAGIAAGVDRALGRAADDCRYRPGRRD